MEFKPWVVLLFLGGVIALAAANHFGFFDGLHSWYSLNAGQVNLWGAVILGLVVLYFVFGPKPASFLGTPRIISFSKAIEVMKNEGEYEAWVYTNIKTLYAPNIAAGGFH